MLEVGYGRAHDGLDVHAGVIVELIVFHGEEGQGHELGKLIERDEKTPFVVELADETAVAGEHGGHQRRTVVGDFAEARQIVGHPLIQHVAACGRAQRAEHDQCAENVEYGAEESATLAAFSAGFSGSVQRKQFAVGVVLLRGSGRSSVPAGGGRSEIEPVESVVVVPVFVAHGNRESEVSGESVPPGGGTP